MIYHRKFIHPKAKTWVVFIHGAGGSNVVWFRQLKEFKKQFNVLLVDLRGHGKSKPSISESDQNYSFDDVAIDIIQIMDVLKIKKAHFVGISLGCIVIRTIDKIAPERAESIILGGAIIQFNKTIKVLLGLYETLGIKDVSYKFYKDGRHEMLNEINRDEVIQDVISWLKVH